MISDLTKKRIARFKKMKRAYYSLLTLGVVFVISLLAEFVANDHPLFIMYNGKAHFPVVSFYPATAFGGMHKTEANYLELRNDPEFRKKALMIFPLLPHSPFHAYLDREGTPPHAPSKEHWLGTDSMARDIATRLLYGFRTCMVFSILLLVLQSIFGILVGGIQGYFGGKTDIVMQRFIEIWSSLPFLYVVILFGSIYGSNFWLLLLIMALFEWIGLSYFMRGEFYKLKNMTYVKAASALGTSTSGIIFGQILPNALTPLITILPFSIIGGISALTALDFLGFGLPPPAPSWGELLQQGLSNLYAPWIAISTIVALFTTLLLTTFVGEGIREAFDPKSEDRLE